MLTTANSSAYECRKLHRKASVCVCVSAICAGLATAADLSHCELLLSNDTSAIKHVHPRPSCHTQLILQRERERERERGEQLTTLYPISGMRQTLQKYSTI